MKGVVMKTAGFFLSAALLLSACASPSPSPDAQLNSRIKQDIARTAGIGNASGINVESSRGIVVLTGYLETEQQRQDAAQTALKVSGVQQVFNNIQVLKPTSSGQ
jgi:osmotically-inducible protein OsmY